MKFSPSPMFVIALVLSGALALSVVAFSLLHAFGIIHP